MVRVVPINLQFNPKTLWFDPSGFDIHKGDPVVVTTVRGREFGHAADGIFDVSDEEIAKLKSELKPVERLATPEDEEQAAEMVRKAKEALPLFKEMAAEVSKDMRPVSVEYLFDGDKAVFYFEAEERVDFRELVRKLASHFRVRVDMRQIGVRDEARIVGGLGHCGQELCCKRLGGGFCPVSIRMAKEQGLSLNPQKISGVCGRLMCCLRYEYDAYKDFKERAPKIGAKIDTPEGPAKVIDHQVPREIVTIQPEEGKPIKIPLAEMKAPEGTGRPTMIDEDTLMRYSQPSESLSTLTLLPNLKDGPLARDAKPQQRKPRVDASAAEGQGKKEKDKRKPRRRTRAATKQQSDGAEQGSAPSAGGNRQKQGEKQGPWKNEGQGGGRAGKDQGSPRRSKPRRKPASQNSAAQKKPVQQGPRPGQFSSSLREDEVSPQRASGGSNEKAASNLSEATGRRKARRRSHKTGQSDD